MSGKDIHNGHSGVMTTAVSDREKKNGAFARKAAAEGMVLLKNEGLLPFAASASLALFGGGALHTVKGGIGSGEVNSRTSVSIYQGLKDRHIVITSRDWIADYEQRYESAKNMWKETVLAEAKRVANPFDAYAAHPFSLPDGRKITPEDLGGADAVVYVVSRIAGEGRDRRKEEGDYYLSKREREDLLSLNRRGLPIVLLVNTGAPLELTDILEKAEQIRAVLYVSLPGQEGGHAVADVLFGSAAPGGRLTTTWAKHYEDYPFAEQFGYLNGNVETEEYREGIYVGYRYFDSFEIEPLFPFGYGLSYTDFSMKPAAFRNREGSFELEVTVRNVGAVHSGREVVQVYVAPPQSGLAKEYRRLVGFAKTGILRPQEEERLTVSVEQEALSSYDEELHGWVLEAGSYGVWIGKHSRNLTLAAVLTVSERQILERTKADLLNGETVTERIRPVAADQREKVWQREAKERKVPDFPFKSKKREKKTVCEQPVPQQPVPELIPLLYGNITQGASTLGSAGIRVPGSAGETTEALEDTYGIRSLIMADGPAGLRLRQSYQVDRKTDSVYGVGVLGSLENGFLEETVCHEDADTYYQYCTAFPVGTALAQSWDRELMFEFGEAVAMEMREFHVDLWLAPGMNIHRNPLCGRNFEYYSEDPLLSGTMAAAVTGGVQKCGKCGVTIKHFACNNQEDNRMGVDVRICERALREIYLRGFEIAVKQGNPAALMSSYNRINGIYSANNRVLCTVVAREEWGFAGVILSDWNTTVPEDGSVPWKCAATGNDIIMPGSRRDDENIRRAYEDGILSEESIRACAGRIVELVRRLTG